MPNLKLIGERVSFLLFKQFGPDAVEAPDVPDPSGLGRRRFASGRGYDKRQARAEHAERLKSGPQRIIAAMTNSERQAWARAGYPKEGKKWDLATAAARERVERRTA